MAAGDLSDRIGASAAPDRVRVVLERIGPAVEDLAPGAFATLVAVAAASDSLGDLLAESADARSVLDRLDVPVDLPIAPDGALAAAHRRELLRIVARDVGGHDELADTMASLTRLAEVLVGAAVAMVDAPGLTVVAMGKAGAGELNVVSDVDVLFVSAGDIETDEVAARQVLEIVGRCVNVDPNLRPEGRSGPLVRTVDSYQAYWDRWAEPWEFQALLKARAVAGPQDGRRAFASASSAALWDRPFSAEAIRSVRALKARAEAQAAIGGSSIRDVKVGPGGIRDIEFSVQLLQLVHGAADPSLRVPDTLGALAQLVDGGYVDGDEAAIVEQAYTFLRRIEHRLQIVRERRTHRIPDDRGRRRRLARTLDYRGDLDAGPTARFDADHSLHRLAVRRVHEGWYFRPLLDLIGAAAVGPALETGTHESGTHDTVSETLDARLEAFGFQDVARARQGVRELASGLTRRSRLMRQMLPLLLEWLSAGPDPDAGLLHLRRLVANDLRATGVAGAFRDSAQTARGLCELVTHSPVAADILIANPDLVARLDDVDRLVTAPRDALCDGAWRAVGWRPDVGEQRAALLRWHRRHLLGIMARDVAGHASRTVVGRDLTSLAEAVLETALRLADPAVPLAIVAFGRLGGGELSYGSDVDVVFVHGGAGAADAAEAERVVASVTGLLRGPTPASRVMDVDIDLRPEGRQGPMARSLDSYTVYLERWAATWERQALLRARPVAGDVSVGRGFASLASQALWSRPPTGTERREIRRMKARIESERIPRGVEPRRHLKLGPGGLADVEWTVQLAQWAHGVRSPTTRRALERLGAVGVFDGPEVSALSQALDVAEVVRDRNWLVGGDADVLPAATPALTTLARCLPDELGTTSAGELLDLHGRVTRRARRVVERRFYDTG